MNGRARDIVRGLADESPLARDEFGGSYCFFCGGPARREEPYYQRRVSEHREQCV